MISRNFVGIDTYSNRAFQNGQLMCVTNQSDVGFKYASKFSPVGVTAEFPSHEGIEGVVTHCRSIDRFEDIATWAMDKSVQVIAWDMQYGFFEDHQNRIRALHNDFFRYNNYRVARVVYSTATFDTPFHGIRETYYAYQDKKIFNLVAPKLAPTCFVYDRIGDLKGLVAIESADPENGFSLEEHQRLQEDEQSLVRHLYTGATFNDIRRHFKTDRLRAIQHFDHRYPKRIGWVSRVPLNMHQWFGVTIHPQYDRTLTMREIYALAGLTEQEIGFAPTIQSLAYSTIPAVGDWIMACMSSFIKDKWTEDTYATYGVGKGSEFKWQIKPADPTMPKIFELTDYFNDKVDPTKYPMHMKLKHSRTVY